MNVTVKNHNGELLALAAVGAVAYLWWKGGQTVPDAPAGSTTTVYTENAVNKVKAGWDATLAQWMPATTTPVATLPPATTTAAPVSAQQSCLAGVSGCGCVGSIMTSKGVYTPFIDGDAGTIAVKANSTNSMPVSAREIAAAAVTAPAKASTVKAC